MRLIADHGVNTISRSSTKFLKLFRKSAVAAMAITAASRSMAETKIARAVLLTARLPVNAVTVVAAHMKLP